jgi:hypothetical protein
MDALVNLAKLTIGKRIGISKNLSIPLKPKLTDRTYLFRLLESAASISL